MAPRPFHRLQSALVRRFEQARQFNREHGDGGYTTETVIVTAMLAILAIAVVGIIVGKVLGKANGIDLGG
ncbi:hypothetical protein AB0J38_11615 [Streptomyces sp. NPDC050095]|uniref:hypothetical protein n=1 Tax=unclassified Streptomyces TaxID=2593676 RepID=UPI003442EF8E